MPLNDYEKTFALNLVKNSIKYYLEHSNYLTLDSNDISDIPASSDLLKNCGCFVTLTIEQSLRGCVGTITAMIPLYQGLIRNAVSAAFFDPRFPGLDPSELDILDFEISVMGEVQEVRDIKAIEVGKHGLIVKKGGYQGLLLPQVATEWNWNREQFIEHTCQKAGLDKKCYLEKDTEVYSFTAVVFS